MASSPFKRLKNKVYMTRKKTEEKKNKNPATRKRFVPTVPHKMGAPAKEIDVEMVFKLAETMLPIESIATILSCCKETLYSRFPDVLQRAREGRKKNLSMCMWEKALVEKDTKMMIWLSKQHLGYKDQMPIEATQVNFNVYMNEVPK